MNGTAAAALLASTRAHDARHWASAMLVDLYRAIDALSDDAFDTVDRAHRRGVSLVVNAYAFGEAPRIVGRIEGAEAWAAVHALADELGVARAEEFTTVRIEWEAAPAPVVQAAESIAFAAAWPTTSGDSSDLDDFTLCPAAVRAFAATDYTADEPF